MRQRIYVPKRIDAPETREAVNVLAIALEGCGACDRHEARERICRLLGWMCERNVPDEPMSAAARRVFDRLMDELDGDSDERG